MAVNAKWFKSQLESLGLNQTQLAKKLKIDKSSISLFFSGKRKLQSEEVAIVAKLFGVEVQEVLENAGIKVAVTAGPSAIAVKGSIGENLRVTWGKTAGSPTIRLNEAIGANCEALRLQTAGTPYDGLDGGIIVFKPRPGVDPEALGRLAIVILKGGQGSLLRVLRRGYQNGRYNLAMINGDPAESEVEIDAAFGVQLLKL